MEKFITLHHAKNDKNTFVSLSKNGRFTAYFYTAKQLPFPGAIIEADVTKLSEKKFLHSFSILNFFQYSIDELTVLHEALNFIAKITRENNSCESLFLWIEDFLKNKPEWIQKIPTNLSKYIFMAKAIDMIGFFPFSKEVFFQEFIEIFSQKCTILMRNDRIFLLEKIKKLEMHLFAIEKLVTDFLKETVLQ